MSRVFIGPYRDNLDLESIRQSIPESGRQSSLRLSWGQHAQEPYKILEQWAEINRPWRSDYAAVFVTENELKLLENNEPLRNSGLEILGKKSFVAGPDSEELEAHAVAIARGKALEGVFYPYEDLTDREKKASLESIGVDDPKKVLIIAEDRELGVPDILKTAKVWDSYRNLRLVKECFEDGHVFPGKRVNELQNACGGAVNFLLHLQAAKKEIRIARGQELEKSGHITPSLKFTPQEHQDWLEKMGDKSLKGQGIDLDLHKSYASYYLKFLEYDRAQPIPEAGLFIFANENNRKFLDVTDLHIALERAGTKYDLNDFDQPEGYHGKTDDLGKPLVMERLRGMSGDRYFSEHYVAARAMHAFADVMKIPKLETPRHHPMVDMKDAILGSNLNFGEFAPGTLSYNIGGRPTKAQAVRVEDHEDLEKGLASFDGIVIESWPEQAPEGVPQNLYDLERRLIADLVIANRLTVKPLGAASAVGRPILIQDKVAASNMGQVAFAEKTKVISTRAALVYSVFSGYDGFNQLMDQGQWDVDHMKPLPKDADYHLVDADEFKSHVGNYNTGLVEALLGSASTHLDDANHDAYEYTYESAKMGTTMVHGGGSRSIMGKFFDGALDALKEGYNKFLSVAIRVPIASRKEGSLKPLLRKHDLEIESGDVNSNYFSFASDTTHVLTKDYMGERQHAIIGPAHLVTSFVGGIGTDYEYRMAMYHNLMVEMRGYGIFPGFENDQKKRIHFINSQVPDGPNKTVGFFHKLQESFTAEERKILDIHFFDDVKTALDTKAKYQKELGLDHHLDQGAIPSPMDLS